MTAGISKKKLKAILIDLDGTMFDTAPEIAIEMNQTFQALNFRTLSFDTIRLADLTKFFEDQSETGFVSPEEKAAEVASSIPLGRIAEPHDVAAVVAFLASPEANYLTGVSIPVEGGYLSK